MYATTLHFGKYEGVPLPQVPSDYLQWVLNTLRELSPWLRAEIARELQSRGGDRSRPAGAPCPHCGGVAVRQADPDALTREQALALFRGMFRKLALVCHPDRGGTVTAMATLNECQEEMIEQLAGVRA